MNFRKLSRRPSGYALAWCIGRCAAAVVAFAFAADRVASRVVWADEAPNSTAEKSNATPSKQVIASALALLEKHCVDCHGGSEKHAALDLTTRDELLKGGQSGDSIENGAPDDSYLMMTVRHESDPLMPFKKPKLSEDEIATLARWIELGAPYDRKLKAVGESKTGFEITELDREHWAFQPVARPAIPEVAAGADAVWSQHPIDRFLLAKLQSKGLGFAAEASRETLIRRVTLDLIGLPPTPEEIDEFVSDDSQDAYERLVDRLLASPHYGERWGRHWLDLARYAETDGFEHDAVRPNSWRYRDYVIEALNADMPYDQFIRQQLAGDEIAPADPRALIATGFNLLGPDMVDSSDQVQRRINTLNDMTDTTSLVFLGLTMGCARCHDHKFEPISQKDYYSFQAHFASARFNRQCEIASPEDRAKYESARREYEQHPLVRELRDMEEPVRSQLLEKKLSKLSPEAMAALETPPEMRSVEQANLAIETEPAIKVSEKEMLGAMDDDTKKRHRRLMKRVSETVAPPPSLPMAVAMATGPLEKTFVLHRGEYTQPGDEVAPSYPEVLREMDDGSLSSSETLTSRTDLANWIASPHNPLTARVMVNRVWRLHFGQGIVATPSNFGTNGAKPTHPELLDWLASEFIDNGWSLKRLHRLMLTSRAYRQVSDANCSPDALNADPENTLYWRMNRLRMEGEVIRDSLLAASGELNTKMGGPGVLPPLPAALFEGSMGGWKVSPDPSDHVRRSVYIFSRRNLRFPFLEVFDAPDNNLSCPARERSTTAPQSLTLLNSDEVTRASSALANRVASECPTQDDQIVRVFRLALGRRPSGDELAMSKQFLDESPMTELCRALFNLNDFVYIE